jgi:hypothetical protein
MQGFSWARANLITLRKCASPNGVSNLPFPASVVYTAISFQTVSNRTDFCSCTPDLTLRGLRMAPERDADKTGHCS